MEKNDEEYGCIAQFKKNKTATMFFLKTLSLVSFVSLQVLEALDLLVEFSVDLSVIMLCIM